MRSFLLLLFVSITFYFPIAAQKAVQLKSPDNQIVFSLQTTGNSVSYAVSYKGQPLLDQSTLALQFDNGPLPQQLKAGKAQYRDTTESYELVIGKVKKVTTRYRELTIPFRESTAPGRLINLKIRAFNDGVAFRYEYPEQQQWTAYTLLDELTTFKLHGDPKITGLLLPSYTSSHEGFYSKMRLSEMIEDTLMDMPPLIEFPGNIYMTITEAALSNYAGMYLSKEKGNLTGKLSPLPGQTAIKVKATLPHQSPWRVLMISDRVGGLLESNMLTSLNEPCKIEDVSWIKPGKITFPWWNGNVLPDTSFAPGNNFETNKYYIDFCARNHIEYHSIVEYGLHQWYMDDGAGFQPGPHADVTTPVPGLDIKQICDYAATVGVGVRFWVHWAALYPKLDSAFQLFEQWGIKGMMVDFMDRDDQEMVNIQEEILQKAAKHKLHIQFHGAYKPTGMHRTYPNEFTREGTLNYETNKWNEQGLSPDHDLDVIFTRMIAGPADYHLGGFRAVPPSKYVLRYTRPLMIGTRCHMMAMYVVLENYQGMVCDYPAAYEGQPGFEFIQKVPTIWDETRVLDAHVGEYIVIARKKNDTWYIGALTGNTPRTISISLDFLDAGTYTSESYTDVSTEEPNQLEKKTGQLSNKDKIDFSVLAGGGAVFVLKKQ